MLSLEGNLRRDVIACGRCSRLRQYCTQIAKARRAAYREFHYWGRPVPGFGDAKARLWIIGLAPGAHGANRTGRVFTGDRSGNFLYAGLHRAGLANQPTSTSREDGLKLIDCYISATARCAPPGNKPTPEEMANCSSFLDREWQMLTDKRVILALGRIAWDAARRLAARHACSLQQKIDFAHGAVQAISPTLTLIGSYHVSQQNTFTGRLTPQMFDQVLLTCLARTKLIGTHGLDVINSAQTCRPDSGCRETVR